MLKTGQGENDGYF